MDVTKADLEMLKDLAKDIRKRKERIEELDSKLKGSRGPMTGTRGSGGASDPQKKLWDAMFELEDQLATRKEEQEAMLRRIEPELDKLPEPGRTILKWRYIEGMEWKPIAKRAKYARSVCFELHNRAIDLLEKSGLASD